MKTNPSLVSLFEVQVDKISEKYKLDPTSYQEQARSGSNGSMQEEGNKELQLKESKVPRRVPEDQLEDMNLGTKVDPKMVKVSKQLNPPRRLELENCWSIKMFLLGVIGI